MEVAKSFKTVAISPLADLLPPMPVAAYEALKTDIATVGQLVAITAVQEGDVAHIIDGRHRFKACLELGIEPRIELFQGSDEDRRAVVASLNVHRRHMTDEQVAIVVAGLSQRGILQGPVPKLVAEAGIPKGTASVFRAKKVYASGNQTVIDAMEKGEVPIKVAAAAVSAKVFSAEEFDKRRNGTRGRFGGDADFRRLERGILELAPLLDKPSLHGKIVANYGGSPEFTKKYAAVVKFLRAVLKDVEALEENVREPARA